MVRGFRNQMSVDAAPIGTPKRFLRRLLGPTALGMIDYFRFPDRGDVWGGPFNGQPKRCELFATLIRHLALDAIVETGTHLGATTQFLADTGLPIFSIEADERCYGFARARLWRRRNVRLFLGDSRDFLRILFEMPKLSLSAATPLFYLDAHWKDDLPLLQEIEIIFSRCAKAIVMIDDFEVPFDAGYGYDSYGGDKALRPTYIASVISKHDLEALYPSTPSSFEGGMRRGCVVLVKRGGHDRTLLSFSLLRTVNTIFGESS
jgi:predicted O-methyltransferase YrrM